MTAMRAGACGPVLARVLQHRDFESGTCPGPQDALLVDETHEAARLLADASFAASWQAQGFADLRVLPGRAVAALQARLLFRLFVRLGLVPGESAGRCRGSAFYREHLGPCAARVGELAACCKTTWQQLLASQEQGDDVTLLAGVRSLLARLPFTTGGDIASDYRRFLCASQDEVARIVTLTTSGSTGAAKRLAFGLADLERTRRFFAAGMAQIVGAGDRLLVCLPGAERPDGVADLLDRGLSPLGVTVAALPSAASDEVLVQTMQDFAPTSLVLSPRQLVFLLSTWPDRNPGSLRSFLVSSDWCDPDLLARARSAWQVATLDHYGITETCFGCTLECRGQRGYHIRHADVFCEIVDPVTGELLPPGQTGELVLTTLRQDVMPLVRYRTGDAASLRIDPCACQSPLSRLGGLYGRFVPGTATITHPRKAERCHVPVDGSFDSLSGRQLSS